MEEQANRNFKKEVGTAHGCRRPNGNAVRNSSISANTIRGGMNQGSLTAITRALPTHAICERTKRDVNAQHEQRCRAGGSVAFCKEQERVVDCDGRSR